MGKTASIIIALAMLLSGVSMASLDVIFETVAEFGLYDKENDFCGFVNACSYLDEVTVNNIVMPEAWLSRLSYEQEDQLKKAIEMIDEQNVRDYLSQFDDCGEVADKLFILKDHEYYHYILLHIIMGIRHPCSTEEFGILQPFIDKNAGELKACENIIQVKIKQLISEGRHFEERPHVVSKCSGAYSMKVEVREEELGLETLDAKSSRLYGTDKASDNPVCTSFLLYMSEGAERCLNCKVYRNGELVACRNLTAWWLKLKEFEYGTIDSEENIHRCKKIPDDEELDKSFSLNGCPSEGIYFEVSQFHKVIRDVAISLSEGQEKRYLVVSGTHDMGLCIKRNKYNNIIIYYYDPNDTLRHKEIFANAVDDLKYLYYDDFWNPVQVHRYFLGQDKVCGLLSFDTKNLQKNCKVVCTSKPSANLMYLLGKYGHCGHTEVLFDIKGLDRKTKKELIAGEMIKGTPVLYMACQNRHLEASLTLIEMITNSDLDPDVKKELFAGRLADGTSSLFMACQHGHHEIVTVLIAGIFSETLNLSNAEKAELLAGKSGNGCPALYVACQNGRHETITVLITAICRGDLNVSNHEKAKLLAGKSEGGCSALYIACDHGHHEAVAAIIEGVFRGDLNLSSQEKVELLAGKNGDSYPALYVLCQHGYHEIVTTLIIAMCRGDLNLNNHEKSGLLAGKSQDGYSALYLACYKGYHKIVIALMAEICRGDLNLNNAQKVELLAGKNEEGFTALYIACDYGHLEVVTALVSAICSDNLSLSQSEKAKLLAGKNADGVSALEIARELGYDKIVAVLRNCGM
ncbi:MAG: ShET2/EspL2 family type III secretion system effector toxin [Candidatus Endonucleobacter bathymodioli]|uniref:ShET2/EspL2 family type III secretion system effector toxin n=1 Tax=Candidatus Endonucleibacter bathymodioli TaxID=539814 RepID=A0AA90SD46_9GAMM|nr:ShET2/EspL2 family type III secretion system effector toxin [Candidatus Endonucleobacter bathymodioli]